jgi:methyltransferase (TIGR00027 family)
MAKTGDGDNLGTAEGALMGRAAHALHAESPVIEDAWAIRLLDAETQATVRDPGFATRPLEEGEFDSGPVFAVNLGSLRYAEDAVERCARDGVDQYVILGAGFDTFALRRGDLTDRISVFEVDHPDVQALKRARIAQADATPDAMPTFVPVDFETTSLSDGLAATAFDPKRPTVVSWMNTLPYISEAATEATLRELVALLASGSRLALNYSCDVPFTEEQIAYIKTLMGMVKDSGEPLRSSWKPDAFKALLGEVGFAILEHLTEEDLYERYFEGRSDGLKPGLPVRVVLAEPKPLDF